MKTAVHVEAGLAASWQMLRTAPRSTTPVLECRCLSRQIYPTTPEHCRVFSSQHTPAAVLEGWEMGSHGLGLRRGLDSMSSSYPSEERPRPTNDS